jgi:hypothetical protein
MDIKKEFERIEKEYAKDKKGTDYYKFEFVESLTDPIDLCRVIMEWSDCFGDEYYSGFQYAVVGAAQNILKKRSE